MQCEIALNAKRAYIVRSFTEDAGAAMLSVRKMHGLGNDFVVLDSRDEPILLPEARIRKIADRRRGIGFDQLLVIEHPAAREADAFMRIYNPDGSEAGACGNGTRCVADLLMTQLGRDTCRIETLRGVLEAERRDGLITVDMGEAQKDWRDIPLARELDILHLPIEQDGVSNPVAVGMGNPHCVFFVDDADKVDVAGIGSAVEHHPLYPQRTNVEFVSVHGDNALRLRVWERGAGITLACGSGTCASVVAADLRGLVDARSAPVAVTVDGGVLSIGIRESDGHVLMTGPAATTFVGEADL